MNASTSESLTRAIAGLRAALGQRLKGKQHAVDLAVSCVLAGGHLLIQDVPGVGKTTLALALSQAVGGEFRRVQFTADMLPADILGFQVPNPTTGDLVFHPGSLFGNIILADEVNRASPKTQSALLEAMAEGSVSIDGTPLSLPKPFFVVATQNPFDLDGTFPLPDSQLDRFLMRISIGYPSPEVELEVMTLSAAPQPPLEPVLSTTQVLELQNRVSSVSASGVIKQYILDFVHATRRAPGLLRGISPRGTQWLFRAAQAWALSHGRSHVIPEDVIAVAPSVIAHRVRWQIPPSHPLDAENQLKDILKTVPSPL